MNLTSLKTMYLRNCTSLTSFPEVLGNMKNIRELDMSDSGIYDLPSSIGNLVGLVVLILTGCTALLELPSSVFMLPKLGHLEANFCLRLAQVQIREGQDLETMSSRVKDASFDFCYLTDKFLCALLPCLRNVTDLSLSNRNITILPSSIGACLSLTTLRLNECKELLEIKGLPPNIKFLYAFNCTSLTSKSKEMLLNQTLHETGGKQFLLPGSTIPSWLNCSSKGPSMRFWFRNKFPAITLCAAGLFRGYAYCEWQLKVNGMQQFPVISLSECDSVAGAYSNRTNHTILSDPLEIGNNKFERLHMRNGWNSAEILFENYGRPIEGMKWIGVHVQKEKTSTADIQFTEPEFSMVNDEFLN